MTQPLPPEAENDPLLKAIYEAAGSANPTGQSSGSKYGLNKVIAGSEVNPGDLPFLSSVIQSGKPTTAEEILKAFATAKPDQIATIQRALFMAGYYTSNYAPQYGVIRPQDVAAFGKVVTVASQSSQPVSQLLLDGAKYGAQAGLQAAQAQVQGAGRQSAVASVNLPNTQDLEALALKAFQSALGHKASPKDAARFAAYYRAHSAAVQRQANQQQYDAQNPVISDTDPLASIDPDKAIDQATGLHTQPMAGPIIPHTARPRITDDGQQVVPETGPIVPGSKRPLVDRTTGEPVEPGFDEQIGGLMTLGQAVAASQDAEQQGSAEGGGLTQYDVEAPISPDVAAENYARNTHPNEAAANDVANTFNVFLSLLAGNFGG